MNTQTTNAKYQRSSSQLKEFEPNAAHDFPKPGPEYEWLHQFVGEWETDMECTMEPGKPALKSKGTERVRSIGELWIVAEGQSVVMDKPMKSILTLGYDPGQKKYVGTWVGSCMTYLWHYKGSVDQSGKALTLETEGPCPQFDGTVTKFREVIEVKSKDNRVFTSSMQGRDGKWATIAIINYRRKKETVPNKFD
jgi:Protein of unknown function (DUF1579)